MARGRSIGGKITKAIRGILMKFRKVAATALALCMAAGFAGYVPAIPDIGITACAKDAAVWNRSPSLQA